MNHKFILIILLIFITSAIYAIFDVEKKYIFTHPPKCGGTSVEIALLGKELFDEENIPKWRPWKHASLIKQIEEVKRLGYDPDDFLKFSIIRNPWERVYSWFKFVKSKNIINDFINRRRINDPNFNETVRTIVHDYYSTLSFQNFVSKHFYDHNRVQHGIKKGDFVHYSFPFNPEYYLFQYNANTISKYMMVNGTYDIDFVIRLEDFEGGLNFIMKRLKIKDYEISHYRQNTTYTYDTPYYKHYNKN